MDNIRALAEGAHDSLMESTLMEDTRSQSDSSALRNPMERGEQSKRRTSIRNHELGRRAPLDLV